MDNEGPRFSELGTQISQRSSLFHYWEDGKSLRRSDANADCTRDVHVKQKSAAILDENLIIQKIVKIYEGINIHTDMAMICAH